MSEALPPSPESRAAEIVAGYWDARRQSEEVGGRYESDVMPRVLAEEPEVGLRVLQGFANSEQLDGLLMCASWLAQLSPEVPKDAYLALVNAMIARPEPSVQALMLETLFDEPIREDLSWLDLRSVVRRYLDKPTVVFDDTDHAVPGSSVPPTM